MSDSVAAICGIFCGDCAFYPSECHGCLSDHIANHCQNCLAGFRECASTHEVRRCNECKEFPCLRLEEFKESHIENGVSHHEHIIDNLRAMKEEGVENWCRQQEKACICPKCNERILWYDKNSHICNKQ